MRCLFVHPLLCANRYGFHSCAMLMMMSLLLTTSAHAQMWAGPVVGYEHQSSYGSRDYIGRGVELGFPIARQQRIDLFLSGYITSCTVGNDADPLACLAIGTRWRTPAMDPTHSQLPFFSLGLGTGLALYLGIIGYIQGEAGIELFAQGPVGIELSIRDKIFVAGGIINSVQASFLLRFGHLNPRHQ